MRSLPAIIHACLIKDVLVKAHKEAISQGVDIKLEHFGGTTLSLIFKFNKRK